MPKVISGPKGRWTLAGGFSPRNKEHGERAAKSAPETFRRVMRAMRAMRVVRVVRVVLKMVCGESLS